MEQGATGVATSVGIRGVRHAEKFLVFAMLGFILAYASSVRADELHLLVNGKAIHFKKQPNVDYNESNWGAGIQYEWGAKNDAWVPFATAAGFNDSNRNPSYYAGGGVLRRYYFGRGLDATHADVGVVGFVMTRKEYKDGDPFLGVLPAFSIGTDKIALNMTYIPRVDPKMVPILFFQLKISLGAF